MLPVPGDLPVEGAWSYEVDWAGVRLLADVDQGELTLCTADGEDVTARFPEFAGLVDAVADGLLDGEAVMLDGGSPSADALGERLGVEDATRARALARERPAVFMVYDVMRLYGVPLDPRPLEERRAVLSRLDLSRATRIQNLAGLRRRVRPARRRRRPAPVRGDRQAPGHAVPLGRLGRRLGPRRPARATGGSARRPAGHRAVRRVPGPVDDVVTAAPPRPARAHAAARHAVLSGSARRQDDGEQLVEASTATRE